MLTHDGRFTFRVVMLDECAVTGSPLEPVGVARCASLDGGSNLDAILCGAFLRRSSGSLLLGYRVKIRRQVANLDSAVKLLLHFDAGGLVVVGCESHRFVSLSRRSASALAADASSPVDDGSVTVPDGLGEPRSPLRTLVFASDAPEFPPGSPEFSPESGRSFSSKGGSSFVSETGFVAVGTEWRGLNR